MGAWGHGRMGAWGHGGDEGTKKDLLRSFSHSCLRASVVNRPASHDAMILILSGEPIDEPVIAHGPFVMITADEIKQAMTDYRTGLMGTLDEPISVATM
jgi:redox-sensitive bicupin YhaK (pirin superfamily)